MRTLPSALQARLDTGCTTLATCWILRRRDGVALGFTDHDRDLMVDGTTCRAASGLDASAAAEKLGFAVGSGEVAGALVDEAIAAADIRAGRYDGARVEVHLADWSDPDLSVLLQVMTIGDITREGQAFRAELRSAVQQLDAERGRLYTPRCAADLGDQRCGIDLTAPGLGAVATVVGAGAGGIICSGLSGFAPGALSGGRLVVLSGAAEGFAVEIAAETPAEGGLRLSLWQPLPEPVAPGDQVRVTAGCDKLFATCRDRFANAANFRGFPHMPGLDRIVAVARPGDGAG